MPDGVEKGFRTASGLSNDKKDLEKFGITRKVSNVKSESMKILEIYPLDTVLLNSSQKTELENRYRSISVNDPQEVGMPDLTAHPKYQRKLGPTVSVSHSDYTKRCVKLFKILGSSQRQEDRWTKPFGDDEPSEVIFNSEIMQVNEEKRVALPREPKQTAPISQRKSTRQPSPGSDSEPTLPSHSKRGPKTQKKRRQPGLRIQSDSDGEDIGYGNYQHLVASSYPEESFMEGEEIRDSETASEDDPTEAPGSLDDFIVATGQVTSPATGQSSCSSGSSVLDTEGIPNLRSFPSKTPVEVIEDSDDEIPDIMQLFNAKENDSPCISLEEINSDYNLVQPGGRRGKRRKIVDDDSDE